MPRATTSHRRPRSSAACAVVCSGSPTACSALNLAQSARARHESYIGPWLPEPVDTSADPLLGAEREEALELAVLGDPRTVVGDPTARYFGTLLTGKELCPGDDAELSRTTFSEWLAAAVPARR